MKDCCVIVSPYFPPSGLAGVHRARHLAKHLPAYGWTPTVLCVDEAYHEERLDPGLARLVPITTEVVKVRALSPRLTRPFGLGEISLRSMIFLRRTLFQLLKRRSVAAVLITGSPYFPMLLAGEIRQRFGVPVVLDFQDPWVSVWGAAQPRLSKIGLSHAAATMLEPRALRGASFVTSVSDEQNAQMVERYEWLARERMAAIPIGSDSEDFEAVSTANGDEFFVNLEPEHIHLSYVGTIWPAVIPTIRMFLEALAKFRRKWPDLYKRLRINFVGTTANSNDVASFRVVPLADAVGVADSVREIPQRLPYLHALSVLVRSDANLMFGSDEPHYTASKIYSCLMSGKPYLSIFHSASSAHEILSRVGGGSALSFSTDASRDALINDICEALYRLVAEPEKIGKPHAEVYQPYEAGAIAERYAAIFEKLKNERERT